jgi:hypothetical protein
MEMDAAKALSLSRTFLDDDGRRGGIGIDQEDVVAGAVAPGFRFQDLSVGRRMVLARVPPGGVRREPE